MKILPALLGVVSLAAPLAVSATWSVAKLDTESKSIVVAGASCSFMVFGIAAAVPGKGVAIVQAASNGEARAYAAEKLGADRPLAEILAHISDVKNVAAAAAQQYALLSFSESDKPLTFTGAEVTGWSGTKTGHDVSVQANTMVGEDVVAAAFALMAEETTTETGLVTQALRALRAGSNAGGDKRCGEATASSAFVSLYRADDNASMPYLNLVVYGIEAGTENAVTYLESLLADWRARDTGNTSTQRFVVP